MALRTAQYVAVLASSVEKENEPQPRCMTATGSMPSAAATCAIVLFGDPLVASLLCAALLASIWGQAGGYANAVARDGSWPLGARSVATAALKDCRLVTGAPR